MKKSTSDFSLKKKKLFIDRYPVRKWLEVKKIGINVSDKTLSLVVFYPTPNAKRPAFIVSLQRLCEIADNLQ